MCITNFSPIRIASFKGGGGGNDCTRKASMLVRQLGCKPLRACKI